MASDQKKQKIDKRGRVHKGGMPAGHTTVKTIEKEADGSSFSLFNPQL